MIFRRKIGKMKRKQTLSHRRRAKQQNRSLPLTSNEKWADTSAKRVINRVKRQRLSTSDLCLHLLPFLTSQFLKLPFLD